MNTKETPILLLTGYLGSGKTTLVNHILSNKRGIKFAVIVNDIGEVNGFYERLSDKFEGTVGIEYVSEIEEKEKYTQEECRIINYIFGLIE